jgi:hypothetical protein
VSLDNNAMIDDIRASWESEKCKRSERIMISYPELFESKDLAISLYPAICTKSEFIMAVKVLTEGQ